MDTKVTVSGICVWAVVQLFFFYEFFLRIFLGTIASDLIHQLNLSTSQFSAIGAGYYITYAVLQIPAGLIAERVGPRMTLTVAALFCVIGVFLLVLAQGFLLAFISRLLIGFGSAFAFVCLLLIVLRFFPKRLFSFMAGLSIAMGGIGPLLAGAPLALLYNAMHGDWRTILVYVGLFGLALALLFTLFVRNQPQEGEAKTLFLSRDKTSLIKLVLSLLKNRQALTTLFFSAAGYVAMPLFAAYFGTMLLQARGFSLTKAATIISMEWLGYSIASPLIGKFSDAVKRRKPFLVSAGVIGLITSCLILYLPINHALLLAFLFMLIGVAVSAQSLSFAVIVENVPKNLHASAIGANSAAPMISASTFPILVGYIVQLKGDGVSIASLTIGMSIIPALFFIAFLIALFGIKETFCRQQNEVYTLHSYSDHFS